MNGDCIQVDASTTHIKKQQMNPTEEGQHNTKLKNNNNNNNNNSNNNNNHTNNKNNNNTAHNLAEHILWGELV